jgi:hypothetical protein
MPTCLHLRINVGSTQAPQVKFLLCRTADMHMETEFHFRDSRDMSLEGLLAKLLETRLKHYGMYYGHWTNFIHDPSIELF